MIDLSNNNDYMKHDTLRQFKMFHRSGQRRVYLKLTEGATFKDPDHNTFRAAARQAGFRVGEYHFARPSAHDVHQELHNFLASLPQQKRGRDLIACIDIEDNRVQPSRSVGDWVEQFCTQFLHHRGYLPLVYGSYFYLSALKLNRAKVGPLWLAWYARDNRYHGSTAVPAPWHAEAALQWSSQFRYPWMPGGATVDISHVFTPRHLDIPRLSRFRASEK